MQFALAALKQSARLARLAPRSDGIDLFVIASQASDAFGPTLLNQVIQRLFFRGFRHSLATALVKLKVDPKTVQGVLRHEDFGTTMGLYAQSDMDSMRDAQGKFLEQLMGGRIHLLTERVQ